MSNHGFYIACSYGALAFALAIELWTLRRHRAQALADVQAAHDEEHA